MCDPKEETKSSVNWWLKIVGAVISIILGGVALTAVSWANLAEPRIDDKCKRIYQELSAKQTKDIDSQKAELIKLGNEIIDVKFMTMRLLPKDQYQEALEQAKQFHK